MIASVGPYIDRLVGLRKGIEVCQLYRRLHQRWGFPPFFGSKVPVIGWTAIASVEFDALRAYKTIEETTFVTLIKLPYKVVYLMADDYFIEADLNKDLECWYHKYS